MSIGDDLLEKEREQRSVPVEESAPGSLTDDNFPAAHHLELAIPEVYLLEFPLAEYFCVDKVQAV